LESQIILKSLRAIKPKSLKRIDKFGYCHLFLREVEQFHIEILRHGTTHIDHGSNPPIIAIYIVCMVMKFANEYILF